MEQDPGSSQVGMGLRHRLFCAAVRHVPSRRAAEPGAGHGLLRFSLQDPRSGRSISSGACFCGHLSLFVFLLDLRPHCGVPYEKAQLRQLHLRAVAVLSHRVSVFRLSADLHGPDGGGTNGGGETARYLQRHAGHDLRGGRQRICLQPVSVVPLPHQPVLLSGRTGPGGDLPRVPNLFPGDGGAHLSVHGPDETTLRDRHGRGARHRVLLL